MNAIRIVISLFIAALIVIAALGWRWTSAHQLPAQAAASHLALGLSIVVGLVGLITIWRIRPDGSKRGPTR
ncbi:MAG TPA: hypothetical protein VLV86_20675 [Vicinamibacterales bacterium]|nr:hypothetical protein [Vicinamibacterales bacterium]